MADVPSLFRIVLQVADLDGAADFYARLLDVPGRRIPGARHYFDCGPVILALLDPTPGGRTPQAHADHVYLSVRDLEAVHRRARELGCLSPGSVHDQSAGEIVTRPWGERSFYVDDPGGNHLCFVDAGTVYTGR